MDLFTFENILVSKHYKAPAGSVTMISSWQAAVTFIPIGHMNVCHLQYCIHEKGWGEGPPAALCDRSRTGPGTVNSQVMYNEKPVT